MHAPQVLPHLPPHIPQHIPQQACCIDAGDVRLAVTRWGEPGPMRPTIVLVHGYPDNSEVWHAVAARLAGRFDVVAYDVRGAGRSTAPQGTAAYRLQKLADDFIAVIDAVSPQRAVHLVGHDWGSIQGWEFVTDPRLRGRIASFTSCSGPCLDHAAIALRELRGQRSLAALGQVLRQLMASWYIGVFHLPWLPELAWRLWLGRAWPRYLRRTEGVRARPNPTQTADGCHGVRLYRANILPVLRAPRRRPADAPVQLIVPLHDRYVTPAVTEGMHAWTSQLWRRAVPAQHWLPLADPAGFAAMVGEFVGHIEGATASAALQASRLR
ncbi:alpha/beta fold hydrolase [Cupriavidus neocaledonicus]|uniref:Oxidoreductase Alpha/beta hydrolase fold n=2 Tax=Cupriavidus neocaledonicus TaxID=1040979 RepID=A0A375H7A7_9BURK|nr:alpha/beta fold hydrolase [Cupriavidus neocaledonicus]SOZ35129.1 putative oxidoreductase; Alpha/beta hydrolase fold [Cupriavidus neocaledonicus]SPD47075.1 Pimeloyl-ACP methyl ester carboxylesterase [Cupriavidus neocaledonicus]